MGNACKCLGMNGILKRQKNVGKIVKVEKLFRIFWSLIFAKCKTICLPPCRNWRFDKTISYANFPSEIAKHFVKDKTKWENLQNTIILDVFYTTLDYTVIQQMLTITPSSFIAQLGGQWLRLTSKLGGIIKIWLG
uniref:Uncharacterized protein n=1 Tax=Meloidogyne incognita TaxID=6306 RepID=A0A914NEQ5_MELIC